MAHPRTGMRLRETGVSSGSASDGVHGPGRRDKLRAVNFVAQPLITYVRANQLGDLVIARAGSQQRFHVCFFDGKKTVTQLAIRSQSQPVAVQAERPRYGSDEAHPADAVGIGILSGRRARVAVRYLG